MKSVHDELAALAAQIAACDHPNEVRKRIYVGDGPRRQGCEYCSHCGAESTGGYWAHARLIRELVNKIREEAKGAAPSVSSTTAFELLRNPALRFDVEPGAPSTPLSRALERARAMDPAPEEWEGNVLQSLRKQVASVVDVLAELGDIIEGVPLPGEEERARLVQKHRLDERRRWVVILNEWARRLADTEMIGGIVAPTLEAAARALDTFNVTPWDAKKPEATCSTCGGQGCPMCGRGMNRKA